MRDVDIQVHSVDRFDLEQTHGHTRLPPPIALRSSGLRSSTGPQTHRASNSYNHGNPCRLDRTTHTPFRRPIQFVGPRRSLVRTLSRADPSASPPSPPSPGTSAPHARGRILIPRPAFPRSAFPSSAGANTLMESRRIKPLRGRRRSPPSKARPSIAPDWTRLLAGTKIVPPLPTLRVSVQSYSAWACLHSPCPEDRCDEVDDGGEAFVGLLVARGNASKGFYAAEEVFNEMPPLVFFPVMLGISAGPLAERNDRWRGRSRSQPASNPSSPIKAKQ
jgi:hypothetical protein